MTWFAEWWHQVRFEVRTMRWLLLVTIALLALCGWWAWPTTSSVNGMGYVVEVPLWLAALLLGATTIQRDHPMSPTAFWAGKPLRPSALVGAKCTVVVGVVGGAMLLVAAACLLAYDVPPEIRNDVLRRAGVFMLLALLFTMGMAATAQSLWQLPVLALTIWGVIALLMVADFGVRSLPREIAPATAIAWYSGIMLVTLLLIVTAYYRRLPRRVGVLMLFVLGCAALMVARARPTNVRGMLPYTFAVDSARLVIDEITLASNQAASPEERLRGFRGPSVTAHVTGVPKDHEVRLYNVWATLIMASGDSVRTQVSDSPLNRLLPPAVQGLRWRDPSPTPDEYGVARLTVSGPVREALVRHLSGDPAARIRRVVLHGYIHTSRLKTTLEMPYGASGSAALPGQFITSAFVRDSTGVSLQLRSRSIRSENGVRTLRTGDIYFPGWRRNTWAIALHPSKQEWVLLRERAASAYMDVAVLPFIPLFRGSEDLRPARETGLEADDPWFDGARLVLVDRETLRVMPVHAEYEVPVPSP